MLKGEFRCWSNKQRLFQRHPCLFQRDDAEPHSARYSSVASNSSCPHVTNTYWASLKVKMMSHSVKHAPVTASDSNWENICKKTLKWISLNTDYLVCVVCSAEYMLNRIYKSGSVFIYITTSLELGFDKLSEPLYYLVLSYRRAGSEDLTTKSCTVDL